MQERSPAEVVRLVKDEGVEVVDLRFCDLPGLMQHFSIPAHGLTEDGFSEGFGFDGSSIRGFQQIHESDMILLPDPSTAVIDPFRQHKTLNLNCFVHDPLTLEPYSRDPRYVAKKAEAHVKSSGVADTSYFGPEAEFFIFDDVRFGQDQHSAFYQVDSVEGIWNSDRDESPNLGYKPRYKEGYFPVPPMDHYQDLRSEMILTMEKMGIEIEVQHHEVGTAGQAEIDMRFDTLLRMADKLMLYKYIVKNVAFAAGLTATFMPKPLFDDNGSGMHVHSSLWNGGEPLFHQEGTYAGLSDIGRWYIGGIIKHARSVLAFAAPTTNSYKRLVPGFEAPVNLVYSQRNRSAACRIPVYSPSPKAKRVEFRCPDPELQPVPGVLGAPHGRPRRRGQQDRAPAAGRPRPLRDVRRRAGQDRPGALIARRGDGRARGRQRLPQGRRGVHPRPDRDVGRLQAFDRDRRGAAPAAPVGVHALLRHLIWVSRPRRSSRSGRCWRPTPN